VPLLLQGVDVKIPGTRQTIDEDDVQAIADAMRDNLLTTGPRVEEFENAFAKTVGSRFAVAVNSGTSALHAAVHACGIGGDEPTTDEVIVPAISFVATSNVALYCNARPVFADVEADTLRIDPQDVERKITPNTKAIIAMDYGGQPCDYAALRAIADKHRLMLISDACHSLGGSLGARAVGSLADCTCFSLHPAKQITCGEGGMITTDDQELAATMRAFRNHGIGSNHRQRQRQVTHRYKMESLGFNYRLTDIQSALGLSQLGKLAEFTRKRNEVACVYDDLFESCEFLTPLKTVSGLQHARHLYVVKWNEEAAGVSRDDAFCLLRDKGIGVNVHYQPIYQQPYYQRRIQCQAIDVPHCPVADQVYETILSLPVFPAMTLRESSYVVESLHEIATASELMGRVA
jgi:perosamine synthetase